jgi:hypothetical protein
VDADEQDTDVRMEGQSSVQTVNGTNRKKEKARIMGWDILETQRWGGLRPCGGGGEVLLLNAAQSTHAPLSLLLSLSLSLSLSLASLSLS